MPGNGLPQISHRKADGRLAKVQTGHACLQHKSKETVTRACIRYSHTRDRYLGIGSGECKVTAPTASRVERVVDSTLGTDQHIGRWRRGCRERPGRTGRLLLQINERNMRCGISGTVWAGQVPVARTRAAATGRPDAFSGDPHISQNAEPEGLL